MQGHLLDFPSHYTARHSLLSFVLHWQLIWALAGREHSQHNKEHNFHLNSTHISSGQTQFANLRRGCDSLEWKNIHLIAQNNSFSSCKRKFAKHKRKRAQNKEIKRDRPERRFLINYPQTHGNTLWANKILSSSEMAEWMGGRNTHSSSGRWKTERKER